MQQHSGSIIRWLEERSSRHEVCLVHCLEVNNLLMLNSDKLLITHRIKGQKVKITELVQYRL